MISKASKLASLKFSFTPTSEMCNQNHTESMVTGQFAQGQFARGQFAQKFEFFC